MALAVPLALAALALTLRPGAAGAATFTVRPGDRIQAAIDGAARGDSVLVFPGTYIEALAVRTAITLAAAQADSAPVVQPAAGSPSAVLDLRGAAVDTTAVVEGFVFRHGAGWLDPGGSLRYGGAVVIAESASPVLRRCRADSSAADWGGGIAALGSAGLRLERCTIDSCRAALGGGGLYLAGTMPASADTLAVTRCTTQSGDGGGVLVAASGSTRLTRLTAEDNRAAGRGGGLAALGSGSLDLEAARIAACQAGLGGGGLYLAASGPAAAGADTVTGCETLGGDGGGLLVAGTGRATLTGLAVTGNTASLGNGGGLGLAPGATAALRRSTLARNTAGGAGGAIAALSAARFEIEGSAADTCRAARGGGLFLESGGSAAVDSLAVTGCAALAAAGGGILLAGAGPDTLAGLTVRSNTAAGAGGGNAVESGTAVVLGRALVAGNTAGTTGGGLHIAASGAFEFLTVDSNEAGGGGDGIFVAGGAPSIRSSIVSRNGGEGVACGGAAVALDFNDVWSNGANLPGCTAGPNDISADPKFVGGDPYDYRLTYRSPAIDAADPAAPVPPEGGARADIGAFEFPAGPRFVAVQSRDPDLVYKRADTITFEVVWEADAALSVTMTADFSALDRDTTYTASLLDTTAVPGSNLAQSRFSVTKVLSRDALEGSGLEVGVTAASSLGGSTTARVLALTIDNMEPPIPILAPLPASSTAAALLVSGTADVAAGADSISVRVNGVHGAGTRPGAAGGWSTFVTLSERTSAISASALDRAGNASGASASQEVTYIPGDFLDIPKPFRAGDAFTIGTLVPVHRVEVRIVNLAGQLIRILEGGGGELVALPWDGRNEQGEAVNAGPYLARIAIDAAGAPRRTEDRALLLVRGGGNP